MAKFSKTLRLFILLLTGFSSLAFVVAIGAFLALSPKLPSVDSLRQAKFQVPMKIYTVDKKLIGVFGEKYRAPIPYQEIPQTFKQAILAAEDDNFLNHRGIDLKALTRATLELVKYGQIKSGGSTITMQVAKNFFLSNERKFIRKFNEIVLAVQIERLLEKDEILGLYLNKIYLGNRAYGIQAAARIYYGKDIEELSVAQFAMIAGLPKAPSSYNPLANEERAMQRRNWILRRMADLKYITDEQAEKAVKDPNTASYHGFKTDFYAPYVAEMARIKTIGTFGLRAYTDGFEVTTTVNSKLQTAATKATQDGILRYDTRHGYRGAEEQLANEDLWLPTLKLKKTRSGLKPVVVSSISGGLVTVLDEEENLIPLDWGKAGKVTRFINRDRQSRPIEDPSTLLQRGDLIRIIPPNEYGEWKLSQLPEVQAAMVAISPENGAIQALSGGFNYELSHFNRVSQANRQPGSNFKPFVYTAALEKGFTAASIFNDAPIVFQDENLESVWRPENDSGKFYGPTRLREALYKSRNLVSIRLLREIGINNAVEYITRFGLKEKHLPKDLSLVLGSYAMTPLKVAELYASFANGGYKVSPYMIEKVNDVSGKILYQANPKTVPNYLSKHAEKIKEEPETVTSQKADILFNADFQEEETSLEDLLDEANITAADESIGSAAGNENPNTSSGQAAGADTSDQEQNEEKPVPEAERVIDERVAFIINDILKDVVQKGTAKRARALRRTDIAGKTGTTNGPLDAWFSGFNKDIVATAWVGFDNNEKLGRGEYGGSAALPIWIEFMKTALEGTEEAHLEQPEGLVTVRIDPKTGLRARAEQQNAIFEIFRKELAPTEYAEQDSVEVENIFDRSLAPEDIF